MRTVKELSALTGISVRTLHYYDEIGLFSPTQKSEAGYRLYDEKALETLQQILFFREFDIPLKEIKAIMDNPALDRNAVLQMQRNMLVAKKERMERLIASIDDILRGEDQMDFAVFNQTEIEKLYDRMAANMSEEQKELFVAHYGNMEEWKKQFLANAETEEVQKNFQKIVEWYGSKEAALEATETTSDQDVFLSYQKRLGTIIQRLSEKKGEDVNSFAVRELIGEYDYISRQMYQLPDASAMMLELAAAYRTNRDIQSAQDRVYGEGSTEFIGRAIEAYYAK